MKNKKQTVFVGVSGGVDSSVSLILLKNAGYNVVGCFIKTWQPDFIECTWKEERRDAMRICAKLGVPFLTIDAEKEYKDAVGMYMVNEYKAGRTPNPDVMCNKEVKFGVFLEKALALGADYVATGHYAQVKDSKLFRGRDVAKDQSYFLWTLTEKQLSKIMFPIGHLRKSEVREIAKKYDLLTAEKKDSQGVCFLGPIDMKDFLKHYMETKEGDVLSVAGEVIGKHDGALLYTLGERHGFTITKKGTDDSRLYVVDRNTEKNTITVAPRSDKHEPIKESKTVALSDLNLISKAEDDMEYDIQTRYQQKPVKGKLKDDTVIFTKNEEPVAAGQSVVIYMGDVVVGGGIVR